MPLSPPYEDRHQRLAGEDPVAQHLAVGRLGVDGEAELAATGRAISSSTSVCSLSSPVVSTISSSGRPSGSSRVPLPIAPVEAELVEQPVGGLGVVGRAALAELLAVERALPG